MHDATVQALRDLAAESTVGLTLRGDCMAPMLLPGTAISVRRRRFYLPGDVIVFRTPAGDLAAHRLLGWRPAGLVTRGDGCIRHDAPVRLADVIGAATIDVPLRSRLLALASFGRLIVRRLFS